MNQKGQRKQSPSLAFQPATRIPRILTSGDPVNLFGGRGQRSGSQSHGNIPATVLSALAAKEGFTADFLWRVLEASDCSILIADNRQPDYPLIYVNKAFERTTGYALLEAVGRNCRFLQGTDRNQPGIPIIRQALRRGRPCRVLLRNYRKDGTCFWNELNIAPVVNKRHRVTHFIGVQNDVTARVAAENELDRYRTLLEGLVRQRTHKLEQKNTALKEVLGQIEDERKSIKRQISININDFIFPMLRRLRHKIDRSGLQCLKALQTNLEHIDTAFGLKLTKMPHKLSPREIEICNLIQKGLQTKDIADLFNVAISTVENQRSSIRRKLRLKNKGANLTTYLQSL